MSNNKENISKLESFMKVLAGHFDNKEQYTRMQKAGKLYPYAKHVNTVCNDKIRNLPAGFQGKFLVEESYYETDGKKHASAHLFLFTDEEEGILLSSYEIPEGNAKNTFTYVYSLEDMPDAVKRSRSCTQQLPNPISSA